MPIGSSLKMFCTWIYLLTCVLRAINFMPSAEEAKVLQADCFRRFAGVRVIIDCTEIFTQRSSALDIRKQLFSNYKHHSTMKFLVGVGPNGSVVYVSSGWGGRGSDKQILGSAEDFLEDLVPGDTVLADRAFTFHAEMKEMGVTLTTPTFRRQQQLQFSPEEVVYSERVSPGADFRPISAPAASVNEHFRSLPKCS